MKLHTKKIKDVLRNNERTQVWLADKMKISKQVLFYRLNSGKATHAKAIARALGMSEVDLVKF